MNVMGKLFCFSIRTKPHILKEDYKQDILSFTLEVFLYKVFHNRITF